MINTESFVGRLEEILAYFELTASGFADEIKVPRSSISHLLSGRNKPSLDFVLKVVQRYPEVNLYWLLNGKGTFPASPAPSPPRRTDTKSGQSGEPGKKIEKIIVFYSDGTFAKFDPEG